MRRAASALIAMLAATLAAGCARDLSAVVDGAAMQAPMPATGDAWRDAESAHVAHRVAPGAGTVLLLREYDPGRAWVIDDETFRKVTLELPRPMPESGEITLAPSDDVRVIEGGSSWPRAACVTKSVRAGRVAWSPGRFGAVDLTLELDVVMQSVSPVWPAECSHEERIHWKGRVPREALGRLSRFQGRVVGDVHVFDETHP
jgi:hypothetical protein